MNLTINPFQQLYFSDDPGTENNFVDLFSAEVLQTAIHPVFQGGNVVLSGTQGCGKTMILTLLRPEIRIAYANRKQEFPVPAAMRGFVSAGINLTRSRITDLVQVTLGLGEETDLRELPYYFADFFNYLVVDDIIKSVEIIGSDEEVFDHIVNASKGDEFATCLAGQDCWFGALDKVHQLTDLKRCLAQRIGFYRRWVNGNLQGEELHAVVKSSKTDIGEPIARTAECLKDCGMVDNNKVPVLIRIDQIEEMHRAFTSRQHELLLSFRKMLNRVYAARDARVHYRAGTRKYGWRDPEYLAVWGSEARLEHRRDYHYIDMDDELFARGEVPNSIFERFAVDAFQKRISYYLVDQWSKPPSELAKSILGKSPSPIDRLSQLNVRQTDRQIDRVLAIDGGEYLEWSQEWKEFLRTTYREGHEGMLDAVLAAAWGRQTGGGQYRVQHREEPPPPNAPWKENKWWRKERLNQAVLQLTTRCQQRYLWWGFKDIASLSGGNITVFLHICHRIWDGFLKSESNLPHERRTELLEGKPIDRRIQAAAILFASNEWFKKLPEEPMGNTRQTFVQQLGVELNLRMTKDLRMAYPGGNGISIALSEYRSKSENVKAVKSFLDRAVSYGAVFEAEHSSKTKRGGRRIKFYLNPILCPRFQIPESRTKEPYYWTMDQLLTFVKNANVEVPISIDRQFRSPGTHPVLLDVEDIDNDI